ncbi:MAG: cell division protein ZapE, partial [Boseongicola sp.]
MSPISTAYSEKTGAGELASDAAQLLVLQEFDRIAVQVASARKKGNGLGRVLGRKSEPITGLYLWGGVGRGKSMLMDLFYESSDITESRRVHFHEFMQEIQAALHQARKTGVDDAIKPVAEDLAAGLRLLCLDEMQITDIADAMIVGRLFERLFDKGVTVVTTSNRMPDDLYKDGLNRKLFLPFIELIKSRMSVVELASSMDYRQDRLEGEQTYFHPANAEARRAIDAIWND